MDQNDWRRDAIWQLIGAILGIEGVLVTALALPEDVRGIGLSIILFGTVICLILLFKRSAGHTREKEAVPAPEGVHATPSNDIFSPTSANVPLKDKASWGMGKRQVIAIVVGIVIYSVVKLFFVQALTFSYYPFLRTSFSVIIASGLVFVVLLFFATKFGPWVGLTMALLGWLFGDFLVAITSHADFSSIHSPWYSYASIALLGFLPGLAFLRAQGHYNTRAALTTAIITSSLGIVVSVLFFLICESFFEPSNWITYFQLFAFSAPVNVIIPISLLIIYDKLERYNTPAA